MTQQRNVLISTLLIRQSQQLGHVNPALSRLLSVAAWRINPSSAARYAMRAAVAAVARPGVIAVLTSDGGAVTSVAFSADGRTLATGNTDGTARLWDRATHRQVAALTGPTGPVSSVAFRPDGTTLATGGADARLWDVANHRPGLSLPTAPIGPVSSVAFSPNGATLDHEVTTGCTHTNGTGRSEASWESTRHRCPGGSHDTVTPAQPAATARPAAQSSAAPRSQARHRNVRRAMTFES